MRVLVCGGRDYADRGRLFSVLDQANKKLGVETIIEGGASGADRLARLWAQSAGIPVETFFADWETCGKAAGPIRNGKMLAEGKPGIVVAFPGGRGTTNMVQLAEMAGVRVVKIDW